MLVGGTVVAASGIQFGDRGSASTRFESTTTAVVPSTPTTTTEPTTTAVAPSTPTTTLPDTTPPTVTLARSAATSSSAPISFTVTGNEDIDCATLSLTTGTDFTLTNISTITSITQTSSDVCTIIAVSTATTNGDAVVSTLTRASTFSIDDTAGNSQTVLAGSPQSVTVTRNGEPNAPVISSVTAGNAQVTVVWSTPASNGSTITDYLIRYSTSIDGIYTTFADGVSTATSATVTGLFNGTAYYFKVAAKNSVGTGSYSAALAAATPTLPTQTVTWSPTTALTTTQSPTTPLVASTSGDGAITYAVTSAGATGCTVGASTRVLTFTTAGSCVVRATATPPSNYLTGYTDVTFTVTLAGPAFTLSSSSESKAQNTAIAGYTISSTGGMIAGYTISPAAPTGLTFNTSTGLLSGTPTTVQTLTVYTITATNATSTATQTFNLTVTALTCATGGVCVVGNTGPGGGIVFYVQASGGTFTCGATLASTCKYLEAAPTSGTNAWSDATYQWSSAYRPQIASANTAIGTGRYNTEAMYAQNSTAGTIARAYRGPNNLSDWYLPSKDELNQLYLNKTRVGGFSTGLYWSSSEYVDYGAWAQYFYNGNQYGGNEDFTFYVRPVRAFG